MNTSFVLLGPLLIIFETSFLTSCYGVPCRPISDSALSSKRVLLVLAAWSVRVAHLRMVARVVKGDMSAWAKYMLKNLPPQKLSFVFSSRPESCVIW